MAVKPEPAFVRCPASVVAAYAMLALLAGPAVALPPAEVVGGDREGVVTDAASAAWVRERARQEERAGKLMARATEYRGAGRLSKALSTLSVIVRRYPRTETAARAQFERANLFDGNHEYRKAFDAYQALIDHFKASPLFADALEGQMRVAERVLDQHRRDVRHGRKRPVSELPDLDTLARMFGNIVTNARFSEQAPRAQYLHAVVLEMSGAPLGSKAAHGEFLETYGSDHPLADDAAFQRAYIDYKANLKATVIDTSRWTAADLALNEFLHDYPESDRAPMARNLLRELQEAEVRHLLSQARFYDRTGKPEAAAVVYRQALVRAADDPERQAAIEAMLEARGNQ